MTCYPEEMCVCEKTCMFHEFVWLKLNTSESAKERQLTALNSCLAVCVCVSVFCRF